MNLDLAIDAAKKAGEIHKQYFNNLSEVKTKGKYELLTKADTESEKVIIETLKATDYNILSEEAGFIDNKSDYCWVVDPLDGTTNFAHGIPWFATSIALMHKERHVLGVVFDVIHNELYTAEKGKGAYFNGKKTVIKDVALESAVIGADWGYESREELIPYIQKIISRTKYFRIMGSAVKEIADIATNNRMNAYFHKYIKPWDMAAGCLIVREAGGIVTAIDGSEWHLDCGTILAANKKIHEEILEVFSK